MGSSRVEGGSNHLRFEEMPLEEGKKMPKFNVINIRFKEEIGEIHWRGGWMQYVFQALPGIDMSRSCHREIDSFIDELMEKRKTKQPPQAAEEK